MTRISCESFSQIYDELLPLFREHWRELGPFKDRMPLSPNLPIYNFLETSNQLITLTARHNGKLVGYLVAKTGPGLHYSTTNQAITDLPYVLPEFRGRGIVVRLFKAAEEIFRAQNVGPWFAGSKINSPLHPSMTRLLTWIGMEPQDIQYSKWIS